MNNKRNPNGFRDGKVLSKADVGRRISAYERKMEEYDKLSFDELKVLHPTLRGTYKMACEHVIQRKIQAQIIEEKQKEIDSTKETITTGYSEVESLIEQGFPPSEAKEIIEESEIGLTETKNLNGFTEEEIKEKRDNE